MNNRVVPDTQKNAERCRCPNCPVYNECLENNNELLFCARGNTKCDIQKRGCLCPHCPNEIEYKLNSFFYCQKGAATEKNVLVKH